MKYYFIKLKFNCYLCKFYLKLKTFTYKFVKILKRDLKMQDIDSLELLNNLEIRVKDIGRSL